MIPFFVRSDSGARITHKRAGNGITRIWIHLRPNCKIKANLSSISLKSLQSHLLSIEIVGNTTLAEDLDPEIDLVPHLDPEPRWIRIFRSLNSESESEFQK